MIALALLVVAAPSSAGADAWPSLEKAAAMAANLPTSPLVARVRAERRNAEPPLDEDISASLEAARAAGPVLALLDAAVASPRCALPREWQPAAVTALADHALANALIDGAPGGESSTGKPRRAVMNVVRAADLAALLARCERPTLSSFAALQDIGDRARAVAWYLAQQRQIDAAGLARIAAALEVSAAPASLDRALAGERAQGDHALDERVADLGRRLDASAKDQAALAAAARDFEKIDRPVHELAIRCEPAGKDRFTVTRAVASALERRSEELLGRDSVVMPDLSGGTGLVIVRAGPVARSCGFLDEDIVVGVNGREIRRMEEAVVEVPRQVARERKARFHVRRGGALVEWLVDVADDRPAPAARGARGH